MEEQATTPPGQRSAEENVPGIWQVGEAGHIVLDTPIEMETATLLVAQLLFLRSDPAIKEIHLWINSPGGNVYAGLTIYDTMQWLPTTIVTHCFGQAGGVAALLLAAGARSRRTASPESTFQFMPLLASESDVSNKSAYNEAIAHEILRLRDVLSEHVATHTGQSPQTVRQDMEQKTSLTASEAIAYGLIDQISDAQQEMDGDSIACLHQEAQEFVSQGTYQQALQAYEALALQCPSDATIHASKARVLVKLGKLQEALTSFTQAISLDQTHPTCYDERGMVLLDLKNYEQALTDFTQALQFDPQYTEAYFHQGQALLALGRLQQALSSFEQARRTGCQNAALYQARGAALAQLQRYEEAVLAFDQALQRSPEQIAVYIDKAQALRQLERVGEALATIDLALQRDPHHTALLHTRDILLKAFQRSLATPPPAVPTVNESQKEAPSSSPATSPLSDPEKKRSKLLHSFAERVSADWQIGDVILDRYEVRSILGEGGMGRVYKVYDRERNVYEAVKSPKPELFTAANGKERFIQEAATWVKLKRHHLVVACHNVAIIDGIPRIFIDYVDGGSLSDWIRTQRLYEGGEAAALLEMLRIAILFAWGLHAAHVQGVIHQDVKPANVMMRSNGYLAITDFGLARARLVAGELASLSNTTESDRQSILVSSRGMTPAYCSPEQAAGRPLSRKTDIWSWGVSVLEMFVGGVTWMSGIMAREVLASYQRQHQGIPPMPLEIMQILDRCFQYQPEARPATMEDIATELDAYYVRLTGQPFSSALNEFVKQFMKISTPTFFVQAYQLHALGRHEEALVFCERAIQDNPAQAIYYSVKGSILRELGRQEEALQAYEQAIHHDATSAENHFNKGCVLVGLRRLEEALTSYEQAIRLDPSDATAHLSQGLVLWMLGRLEEALASYEQAIHLAPNFADAYYNQGKLLRQLGRVAEAEQAFQKVRALQARG